MDIEWTNSHGQTTMDEQPWTNNNGQAAMDINGHFCPWLLVHSMLIVHLNDF